MVMDALRMSIGVVVLLVLLSFSVAIVAGNTRYYSFGYPQDTRDTDDTGNTGVQQQALPEFSVAALMGTIVLSLVMVFALRQRPRQHKS